MSRIAQRQRCSTTPRQVVDMLAEADGVIIIYFFDAASLKSLIQCLSQDFTVT